MRRVVIIIWIVLLEGCVSKEPMPPYTQEPEIKRPTIFADTIRTLNGINFSNDGFTLYTSGSLERTFDNGRQYAALFKSDFRDGIWTEPQRVDLEPDIDAYHPVLSLDNQFLYFISRSHLDSGNVSVKNNIWVAQRQGEGWGSPTLVESVTSNAYDSYPTIAKNNNLYFNSSRDGGKGGMDIYLTKFVNGSYLKPVNIEALNSEHEENDLVIDPEERFIIFNRYFNSTRGLDLFISFKKENGWTTPRLLDNINTRDGWELTPSLSPDGKYFFYELNSFIMQIDLAYLIYPDEIEGLGKREDD